MRFSRIAALVLLAVALSACVRGPTIGRAPGIEPVADPQAVISAALDRIAQMENVNGKRLAEPRITSVIAMTGAEAHEATGWGPDGLDAATVWLVEAEGTFTPVVAGEPVGWPRPSSSIGWIVVRDVDAVVLASGMAATG